MDLDWQQQLWESAWWMARAFGISAIALALVAWALSRWTDWGRKFWRLAWPYLTPRRSWRPLLTLAALLFLAMFSVRMTVLFSFWYNGFYSALQALDPSAFWRLLGIFSILATVHVVRALIDSYAGQAFDIHWRVWLNDRLTGDWLDARAYYRGHFIEEPVDNPDQRIEQDIAAFVTGSRTLAIGALSAVVSLVAFTAILWNLSGALDVAGVEIPRAMVFMVYLYVIVATLFAFRIGRPLIRLNFLSERLTANFRYALLRLRENAENVAFYQGEAVERAALWTRFSAYIANLWARVYRGLKFDGFNLVVSQVAVVFPFLLQAQRFFSGAIKLGDVMQTSQAFGQVQDSLSFFRTSYDAFAQYRATLNRLAGFLDANAAARAAGDRGAAAAGRAADHRIGRVASRWPGVAAEPGSFAASGAGAADQGAVRQRQDHLAARPGGPVAPCARNGAAAAGRGGAVPVAASLSAAGQAARCRGLSRACAAWGRCAPCVGIARGESGAPGRPAGSRGRLVAHPLDRRTAARGVCPRAVQPARHRVPGRGHLGHRRRAGTHAVRLAARATA